MIILVFKSLILLTTVKFIDHLIYVNFVKMVFKFLLILNLVKNLLKFLIVLLILNFNVNLVNLVIKLILIIIYKFYMDSKILIRVV